MTRPRVYRFVPARNMVRAVLWADLETCGPARNTALIELSLVSPWDQLAGPWVACAHILFLLRKGYSFSFPFFFVKMVATLTFEYNAVLYSYPSPAVPQRNWSPDFWWTLARKTRNTYMWVYVARQTIDREAKQRPELARCAAIFGFC